MTEHSASEPISSRSAVSRTQQKRAAKAIEELAEVLMGLPSSDIQGLPVKEDLKALIREGSIIRTHGARKRYLKFLAKNLRNLYGSSVDGLRDYLGARRKSRTLEIQTEKDLAALRDRLLSPDTFDAALEELTRRFPNSDLSGIKELGERNRRSPQHRYVHEMYRRLSSVRAHAMRQGSKAS